ncbi:tape measure protein [Acidovorax phage ACF1]|nr:tape measure protein [Acidovorax phage ACF1]
MASSNRDVKLTLSVESLGAEGIKQLQTAVEALAREGGAAAPEFQQLADEISRLGQQNQALTAFKAIRDETAALAARQEEAAASAGQMAERLLALRDATEQARARQVEATKALNDGQLAQAQATANLRSLKAEYDAAGKNTAEYRARLLELTDAQGQANVNLVTLRQEQAAANKEASAAASAQNTLEKQYTRTSAQVEKLGAALKQQETSLRESAAAAEALGVSTDDIAAAEGRLLGALQASAQRAAARTEAIREMAEADRLAAIQEQTMLDLLRRGEQALAAEAAAQRDAARAVEEYERAKQAAAASADAWQREADAIVEAAASAQRLTKETELLIASQRELAAQNAFEQQVEESRKLVQAAEYVRFWETALEQAEAQVKQTADAAQQAAQRIDSAFSTLGVRSVQEVQREIAETRVAMATLGAAGTQTGGQLAGAFAAGEAKIKALEREIRELNGTLTLADRTTNLFKNSLGQIAAGNLVADAVGYLVNKVKELGAAFVDTIAKTESLRRGLTAVYKDLGTTASQMLFLRSTALDAGVAVGSLGPSFLKFSAATASANIPLSTTNALFAAVTKAAGTLGLSGEEVGGMLEALSQMASKGTVSLEELRQQLGDRLPGALSLVAKGFGITEAELIKLVESGQLAARDLFPALTKSLQSMSGEVTGLTPAWENLKTALTQTAQNAGDAGWTQLLTLGIKALALALGAVLLPLQAFGEVIFGVAKTAGVLLASIVTLTNPMEDLRRIVDEASARQTALSKTFGDVIFGAQGATAAVQTFGAATQQSAQLSYVLQQATISTAAGLKLQGDATKILGDANLDASQKIVKLNVEVGKLLPQLEAQALAAEKVAKAVKIEGDALVATIALRGSERDSLEAQLTATQRNLEAQSKTAEARQAATEALILQRDALIRLASTQEGGVAARKQELDAIEKKILTSSAETEQSKAAVAQLQQEVAARGLARQAYEDNSENLEVFKAAAVAATVALEQMRRGVENGTVTQNQFDEAQRGASVAMGLYRDALNDTVAKIDALSKVEQANYNVKTAGLSVQQQAYQQLAAAARATGDLSTATYYEIEAKRIQIEVTRLQAEAKSKEAEASIKATNAELEALKATNSLTEIKRLEIEARLANAKAKQIEATASETVIRALEAEINQIRQKGSALGQATSAQNANTQSLNDSTAAIGRNTSERERNIAALRQQLDLQEQEDELRRRQLNVDKDGFAKDNNGGRMLQSLPYERYIYDTAKAQGLDDKTAMQLTNRFWQNGQATGYAGQDLDWFSLVNKTISETYMQQKKQAAFTGGGSGTMSAPTPSTTPTETSAPKTVNINIGTRSGSFKMASNADADALVQFLRGLENAAGNAA